MERKREHGDACTGLHAKRMHLDVSAHDDDDDTSPEYQPVSYTHLTLPTSDLV